MSNIVKLPVKEQCYQQASEWIARLDRQLSQQEQQELQDWIAASPENQATLMEMASLWDKMDTLQRLSSLFPEPAARHSRRYLYAAASVAALCFLCLSLWLSGFWWQVANPVDTPDFVYQTDVGEQSTVTLLDGTQLVLNTNTKVQVEYSESARLLTLLRGEIYVEVARDPQRPLSVFAGQRFVQAIGTAFNVEITDEQGVELVVLEGKVKVGIHQAAAKSAPTVKTPQDNNKAEPKYLVAGEALLMSPDTQQVQPVSVDDIEVKLSWRQGNLIFRGESLEEAVREIERYTPVEFVFLDEELKKVRVAGLFRAGDVDGLLATLRENFNILYHYTNDQKVELNSPE